MSLYSSVAMKHAHPSSLVLKHNLSVIRIELERTPKEEKSQRYEFLFQKKKRKRALKYEKYVLLIHKINVILNYTDSAFNANPIEISTFFLRNV